MPNMWRGDGTPAVDQSEPEYLPQPHWVPLHSGKGWVGVPTTPADDFQEPYEDGWDLI